MQTCSRCESQVFDSTQICPTCGADLREFSISIQSLKKMQQNKRVLAVTLFVPEDACPTCQEMRGVYPKDKAPFLPVAGCSEASGCRCFYEPILDEIYP